MNSVGKYCLPENKHYSLSKYHFSTHTSPGPRPVLQKEAELQAVLRYPLPLLSSLPGVPHWLPHA